MGSLAGRPTLREGGREGGKEGRREGGKKGGRAHLNSSRSSSQAVRISFLYKYCGGIIWGEKNTCEHTVSYPPFLPRALPPSRPPSVFHLRGNREEQFVLPLRLSSLSDRSCLRTDQSAGGGEGGREGGREG